MWKYHLMFFPSKKGDFVDHYNQLNSERQRQYAHQYHSSILNNIRIEDLMIRMSEFTHLGYVKCSSIPDLLDMDINV